MMVHMVASGETSGELEQMLERSAVNQERELEMMLGVAMGQIEADDEELAVLLRGVLDGMEGAFERCLRAAMDAGENRSDLQPRDAARQLVALSQGMALLGRVSDGPARSRSIIRAALAALRPVPSS